MMGKNVAKIGHGNRNDAKTEAKIRDIMQSVIKDIRPDITVIKDVDEVVAKINTLLKRENIAAECVKGGSIAKDTFLKDDYDIDLFIRYNPSYRNKDISSISERILKELCAGLKARIERIHGSRDYFQFNIQKKRDILSFEVIPVILVHSQNYQDADNITDLSPEHVTWVKRYTDKKQGLTDEIRLAKQFCKANKVYGAESYINGFSGHILDILVIHYGSFYGLIRAFSRFDERSIDRHIMIDTEKNLKDPIRQLNKSKITPLIIVDPIQKDRNSAAALSRERLIMFIDAAKRFLEKPDRRFFEIRTFDMAKEIDDSIKMLGLKKNSFKAIHIEMDATEGSKDVVGTKALKAYESIVSHTKMYGFKILKSDWNFLAEERRAEAYMLIDEGISKEVLQEGPPIDAHENYKKFLDKHKMLKHKVLHKGQRVYALIPRKFIEPKAFVEDLSKKEFIKSRVKSIFIR